MNYLDEYLKARWRLDAGHLPEGLEDDLADRMDRLWHLLTIEEIARVRADKPATSWSAMVIQSSYEWCWQPGPHGIMGALVAHTSYGLVWGYFEGPASEW